MSYKSEVKVDGDWSGNALVFATEEEALEYGKDLFSRWTATSNYRAKASECAVTHQWNDDTRALTNIESGTEHIPPKRVTL